jgi:hypothetical protein
MNVIYHLIGIAMAIIIIAKLDGEIEQAEPDAVAAIAPAAVTAPSAVTAAGRATPASWTPTDDNADAPQAAVARATFMGYPCLQSDCAGNLSGYRWAEENGITEPAGCEVLSGELADGCRLFARLEQRYNI